MKTYLLTINNLQYRINTFRTIDVNNRIDVQECYMTQFGTKSSDWVIEQICLGNYKMELK
jgi:hypothetical protein